MSLDPGVFFEDQERIGIHSEISSWFKFVSFAFDPKAKCRKITEETFKKKKKKKKASSRKIGHPDKKAKSSELRRPQASLFTNSYFSKKE